MKSVRKLSEAALQGKENAHKTAIQKPCDYYRNQYQDVMPEAAQNNSVEEHCLMATERLYDVSILKEPLKKSEQKISNAIDYFETEKEYLDVAKKAKEPQLRDAAIGKISDFKTLKQFKITEENSFLKPGIAQRMISVAKDIDELTQINVDDLKKHSLEDYLKKMLSLIKDNPSMLSAMQPFAQKAIENSHTDAMKQAEGTHYDSVGYTDCHNDSYQQNHVDDYELLIYYDYFRNKEIDFDRYSDKELAIFVRYSPYLQQRLLCVERINDEKELTRIMLFDNNLNCRKKPLRKLPAKIICVRLPRNVQRVNCAK